VSGVRPRLTVVADPAGEGAERAASERSGVRVAFAVLTVLVFGSALAAAFQTRRVAELTGEVAALNGQLAVAERQIDAYRGRLVEIRGAVGGLHSQLAELDALVESDPTGSE